MSDIVDDVDDTWQPYINECISIDFSPVHIKMISCDNNTKNNCENIMNVRKEAKITQKDKQINKQTNDDKHRC